MDEDSFAAEGENGFEDEDLSKPRTLPADLPKSLDDRQPVRSYPEETEYYDGWQGKVKLLQRILIHRQF